MTAAVLDLHDVTVRFGATVAVEGVTWCVAPGERWVVVGANGSGKTTLLRVAAAWLHPSAGTATVLGHTLGRVDVRTLRPRIGIVSAAVAKLLRPELAAIDVVVTARHAALEPWWHTYGDDDRRQAQELLAAAGLEGAADRPFAALSEGERQQVLLARSLMQRPELLLLDEPAAGLDLAARERLVDRLATLAADPATPPTVFVTHHLEEVPPGFTHALVLRQGTTVACGPLEDAITERSLSDAFGLDVALDRPGGRFLARARR